MDEKYFLLPNSQTCQIVWVNNAKCNHKMFGTLIDCTKRIITFSLKGSQRQIQYSDLKITFCALEPFDYYLYLTLQKRRINKCKSDN